MKKAYFIVAAVLLSAAGLLVLRLPDSPEKAAAEWAQALKSGNQAALSARTCAGLQKAVPDLKKLTYIGLYTVGTVTQSQIVTWVNETGPFFQTINISGVDAEVQMSGEHKYVVKYSTMQVERTTKLDHKWRMKLEGSPLARWKWCGSRTYDAGVTIGFLPRSLAPGKQ